MPIIGLTGYARSGKDTVGEYLVAHYGFTRLAFADVIRDVLMALDPPVYDVPGNTHYTTPLTLFVRKRGGWDRAKENKHLRGMLQRMGTEAGRNILGPDVWVDAVRKRITGPTVITDIRFANETRICDRIWYIARPGVGPLNGHSSEDLSDIAYDVMIVNRGTVDQLLREVDAVCEEELR